MAEIIVSIVVAVTGLITALWGIIKYYDSKREKKQTERDNFINEMREENKQQSEKIDELSDQALLLNEELVLLKDDVSDVKTQLNVQGTSIHDNEISRLQTSIMDFAAALRNGHSATANSFNYICHAYDKYKALGGNSFIDSEMEFIKKKMSEINK